MRFIDTYRPEPTVPTLENQPVVDESEEKKEKEVTFPDVYVVDSLDISNVKGIHKTLESLEYHSEVAANQMALNESTMEVVARDAEMTPLSARVIRSQIKSSLAVIPQSNAQIEEGLEKILTSDGPLTPVESLEALQETQAAVKPTVTGGLRCNLAASQFLLTHAAPGQLKKILDASHQTMKAYSELNGIGSGKERLASIYPQILAQLTEQVAPEDVPGLLKDIQGTVSVTAITCIARGLKRIPVQSSRSFSASDLRAVTMFLEKVLSIQDRYLDFLSPAVASEENDPKDASASSVGDKSVALGDQFQSFLRQCYGVRSDTEEMNQDGQKTYFVIAGWPAVTLKSTGQSETHALASDMNPPVQISYSDISDLITVMARDVIPVYQKVVSKAREIAEKTQALENSISAQAPSVKSTGTTQAYGSWIRQALLAAQFVSKMEVAAGQAILDLTSACNDVARGIGILVEN